jgi:hypothetical protein
MCKAGQLLDGGPALVSVSKLGGRIFRQRLTGFIPLPHLPQIYSRLCPKYSIQGSPLVLASQVLREVIRNCKKRPGGSSGPPLLTGASSPRLLRVASPAASPFWLLGNHRLCSSSVVRQSRPCPSGPCGRPWSGMIIPLDTPTSIKLNLPVVIGC